MSPNFDPHTFRGALERLMDGVGLVTKPAHGYGARVLDAAERRIGAPLPAAMRVHYGLVGKHRAFTHMHNRLLSPAKMSKMDGLLVFQDEVQHVCKHAIREGDLALADPPVVQRSQRGEHVNLYDDHYSRFIARSMCWEAIMYHSRINGPFRTPLGWTVCSKMLAEMTVVADLDREACVYGDGVAAVVFAARDGSGYTLYAGSAQRGALTAFIERFGLFSGPRWRSAPVT